MSCFRMAVFPNKMGADETLSQKAHKNTSIYGKSTTHLQLHSPAFLYRVSPTGIEPVFRV
jgi:hypothetical protein